MSDTAALRAQVAARSWYHTIELAPGVSTPGWFDLRAVAGRLPLPARMDGMRCLDVGTFDGFWAFELERRGAAEVIAADVPDAADWDWPAGTPERVRREVGERKQGAGGFALAAQALGSRVRHVRCSVYDLDPDELGAFDFVYAGSLLLHLRDPVRALERMRGVCRGQLLSVDAYDPLLSLLFPRRPLAALDGRQRPWWWLPNLAGLRRMLEAAGFAVQGPPLRVRLPRGAGQPRPLPARHRLGSRDGRRALAAAWIGDSHAAFLARAD